MLKIIKDMDGRVKIVRKGYVPFDPGEESIFLYHSSANDYAISAYGVLGNSPHYTSWVGWRKDQIPPGFQGMLDYAIENEFYQPLMDWCQEEAPEPFQYLFTDLNEFVRMTNKISQERLTSV